MSATGTPVIRAGSNEAEYTIVLPGTWASIPLDNAESLRKRVAALVKNRVGMDDRLARIRKDTRDQLIDAAERARAIGAVSFLMSLELVPGLPFPASMIVDLVEGPFFSGEVTVEEMRQTLAAAHPDRAILVNEAGAMTRGVENRVKTVDGERSTSLSLEYHLPHPAGGLLRFTISVPTYIEGVPFVDLFDAILDSVRWTTGRGLRRATDA